MSWRLGLLLITVGLAGCWAVVSAFGGADSVPPHLYYVPIVFAGLRFGLVGAAATAVVSTVLAGPLTLADTMAGVPQSRSEWLVRGVFFVVIGEALTALAAYAIAARERELVALRAAREVQLALADGRVEVHFQPVVTLATSEVRGAEALVRLRDIDGSLIAPDRFIPDAERNGSIRPLGAHVLRAACTQLAAWERDGLAWPEFLIGVNLSPRQLDDPEFPTLVSDVLAETGLDPGRLVLEVTETALADDRELFLGSLQTLRDLGVHLAMDDFGTGHSTLIEVKALPVDAIKIDREFVSGLEDGDSAIVANVLDLAAALGLTSVAEGVETFEQAQALGELGCVAAQGFLYGRPVPADRFAQEVLGRRRAAHLPRLLS